MPAISPGVVTSSSQFFRQIGSTMGVALFGTFLTNHLNEGLGAIMPGDLLDFEEPVAVLLKEIEALKLMPKTPERLA